LSKGSRPRKRAPRKGDKRRRNRRRRADGRRPSKQGGVRTRGTRGPTRARRRRPPAKAGRAPTAESFAALVARYVLRGITEAAGKDLERRGVLFVLQFLKAVLDNLK
jgi:hypothetical protein